MKKSLLILSSVILVISLTACSSLKGGGKGFDVATASTVAKIAAKDATYYALKEHPEWRANFEEAYREIYILASQSEINISSFVQIIQRLPVKELKGTTAAVIITDVQIVVQQIIPNNGQIIGQDVYNNPRQVIEAIRDGLRIGLDMP